MYDMKTGLALILTLMIFAGTVAAQPPSTVEKTEISGVSEDKLSAALRADIQKLVGQAYDAQAATQIAERIQTELPEYVATSTTASGSQAGRVRLVFSVAHNVNAKYIVEAVEVKNIDRTKISDALWADMQKMVGHPVDDAEADRLRERLAAEFKKNGPHVGRSVIKGDQPQHVKIIYEGHSENSFGFGFSNPGYHSKQKFSGLMNANYNRLDITGVNLEVMNKAEPLLERFAGFKASYWVGNKRIRAQAEYSSLRTQWSAGTLLAAAANPAGFDLYRHRNTIAPSVKVTVTDNIHITLGVDWAQLQMQSPALHFESVRTAKGSVDYSFNPGSSGNYGISGGYDLHTAGNTSGSNAAYTRHVWSQSFAFWKQNNPEPNSFTGPHRISVDFKLGKSTGSPPMFERFALGSIDTLRGWNKYEISPLGGNRMAYLGVTYMHKYGRVFYENGSVWNGGQPKVLRKSIGANVYLGTLLHAPKPFRLILNIVSPGIGVPITGSHVHPVITFGGGN